MPKYIKDFPEITRNGKKYLKIMPSEQLIERKGYRIEFEDDIDLQMALFRIDGHLYCVSNICLHRHAREIYKGYIQDDTVICPLHGWTYNFKTGHNINEKQGKACLKVYDIFEFDEYIYVEKPTVVIPKWRSPDAEV